MWNGNVWWKWIMHLGRRGRVCLGGNEVDMMDILEALASDILPDTQEIKKNDGRAEWGICHIPEENNYKIDEKVNKDEENKKMDNQETMGEDVGGGKKPKWGPVMAGRRRSRIMNDGRTPLEKAKDNKKK
jgi:hypothetical protein